MRPVTPLHRVLRYRIAWLVHETDGAVVDLLVRVQQAHPFRVVCARAVAAHFNRAFEHRDGRVAIRLAVNVEARTDHADLAVSQHHAEGPVLVVNHVEQCLAGDERNAPVVLVADPTHFGARVEVSDAALFEGDRFRLAGARGPRFRKEAPAPSQQIRRARAP